MSTLDTDSCNFSQKEYSNKSTPTSPIICSNNSTSYKTASTTSKTNYDTNYDTERKDLSYGMPSADIIPHHLMSEALQDFFLGMENNTQQV